MAIVSVPASTANIGAGFDALGIGLELRAVLGTEDAPPVDRAAPADARHPATIAFRAAGGVGGVWVRSPIPSGRGLGFSGAVRVGGAALAHLQRGGSDAWATARTEALRVAVELEGHPENAAASMYGGLVVAAGGHVVPVRLGLDAVVVAWIPDAVETSTDVSRRDLPDAVAFDDAVFNVGRASLAVAALATGDAAALRAATQDRLHQDRRLARVGATRDALDAALASPALAAWLSGSGPTIAALCRPQDAQAVAASLPAGGQVKVLDVAANGVDVLAD